MGRTTVYGIALLFFAILIVAAVAVGEASFAIPIAILAVLILGFFLANDLLAKRDMDRHGGDVLKAQADSDAEVPTAHVIADETALGDTREAHAEISPHDLPPDAPGRKAAEEQAAGDGDGTTRGNAEGAGEDSPELRDSDAPPSKDEGYAPGEAPSSPRAR